MSFYVVKADKVMGYTFAADIFCVGCTEEYYGQSMVDVSEDDAPRDYEGNPVRPLFASECALDEFCGDCFTMLWDGV